MFSHMFVKVPVAILHKCVCGFFRSMFCAFRILSPIESAVYKNSCPCHFYLSSIKK